MGLNNNYLDKGEVVDRRNGSTTDTAAAKAARTSAVEQPESKSTKNVMRILFGVLLFDLLAFTLILPLFPSILEHYAAVKDKDPLYSFFEDNLNAFKSLVGAPNVARFNNVFFGGVLGSLFSFLQFVSSPTIGALSDVFGRKPLMLVAVSGSLVSYIVWANATTFSTFVLSRVIGGLSKASISIAIAIVADVHGIANRAKGMAVVGIAFSVGFLIGPSIGAYFAATARTTESNAPAFLAVGFSIVELLIITFLLPETLPAKARKKSFGDVISSAWTYISPPSLFTFKSVEKKMDSKDSERLTSLGVVYFLYLLFYSGLEFTLPFFTHIKFEYQSREQGKMYFFAGLIMIAVQGGYVRRIKAEKQISAVKAALMIIVPGFLIVAFSNVQSIFYVGLSLYSIASGIVVPCLTTLVSNVGGLGEKGGILGTFRSLGALARAIGPILFSPS